MDQENKLCAFCDNIYKYICSSCQRPYCSLDCYRNKKHFECSEEFYKSQVMEVLQQDYVRPDDKKKMLEILKRVEDYGSNDDENSIQNDELLLENATNLNLDENIDEDTLWSCLTEKGKQEFKRNLTMGTAESFIEVWHPWWLDVEKKVQEIDHPSSSYSKNYPPIEVKIVDFCKITSKPPPGCLKYNLINVLYSYVFVTSHYNGDHLELSEEATECFLNLCAVFSSKKNFENAEEAIVSVINLLAIKESCCKMERKVTAYFIEDVIKILKGPSLIKPLHYVLLALSDLKALFKSARKAKTQSLSKISYLQIIKKIDFYLSWTKDFGKDLKDCIISLEMEQLTIVEDIQKFSLENECVERKKQLIVELN